MIRLKSLLEQSIPSDKNKDNVTELPRVLFIGDAYTKSRSSYANRLIKNRVVQGRVVAWPKINIKQLVKLTKRYVSDKYSIVSIMFGDIVKSNIDINTFKQQLVELENAAKSYGAQLIIIQNPQKQYSEYKDFLDAISNINASSFINANSDLNVVNTQALISKTWANVVTNTLNIEIPDSNIDTLNQDIEKSSEETSNNAERIPTERAPIPTNAQEFIKQWSNVAREHQSKYGVPSSITLAQGGLESGWGKSGLATKYNNYFGITGKYNGNSVNLKDSGGSMLNFRVYPTPEESFEDHAQLLKRKYTPKTPSATYVEWANTLQQNGYATDPNYAESLIKTIEKFGLNDYDNSNQNISMKLGDIYKGTFKTPRAGNRDFGMQMHPIQRTMKMHWGVDYAEPQGTPIIIVKAGKCILSASSDSAGEWIKIQHEDGSVTTYMHLSERLVDVGDNVKAGTVIGLVGSTGMSTGPHLHWEYQASNSAERTDGKSIASDYFSFGNKNNIA